MIRPLFAAPLGLALCASLASAQVRQPGTPVASTTQLTPNVPTLAVPSVNVPALQIEDRYNLEHNIPGPLRFGYPVVVGADIQSAGRWDVTENGDLVWRLHVSSPGAHSLGIEFSRYVLVEGAQIHLYSPDMETVFGAYTSYHNQSTNELAIEPFPGEELIVELRQPAGSEISQLVIGRVIHDYNNIFEMERRLDENTPYAGDGSGDGGCTIQANCPDGDPYDNLRRATVRTVFGGGLCSASLINNTSNDGTRLVYTANHCGQGGSTVFRFNYRSANCNGSGGTPTGQNVSGATLLATHSSSDGRLLRINNNIPASYNPYYNGWSRQTQNMTLGVCFHHPNGGPKCVAIDNNGGGQATVGFQGLGNISCWSLNFSNGIGGTAPGSSGSPIQDQNGRTRGALTGGPAACEVSYYGRLNVFWNNSANLRANLDPLGTNTQVLDGFDPSNPGCGGGGNEADITSVSPASVAAVNPDAVTVTLTGTGFTGVTKVTVGGIELATFPPQWQVVNDTTLTLSLPQLSGLGNHLIELEDPVGDDSANITVIANLTPTIDLVNSNPGFLLSALGAEVRMGSLPNDTMFLVVSPVLGTTALPGLFTAGIGAGNFANLVYINSFVINPAAGWTGITVPFSLPTGFAIHFQGFNLSSLLPALPLTATNIESGTVLF